MGVDADLEYFERLNNECSSLYLSLFNLQRGKQKATDDVTRAHFTRWTKECKVELKARELERDRLLSECLVLLPLLLPLLFLLFSLSHSAAVLPSQPNHQASMPHGLQAPACSRRGCCCYSAEEDGSLPPPPPPPTHRLRCVGFAITPCPITPCPMPNPCL